MTNFNPDGNFKEIEQWEDLAELKASNTGIVPRVIGGTVAGVFGLTFGIELVGGVAAAWLFKTAWDSFRKSGSKLTLVRNNGCNAFVLDEQNFRAYTKQFGDEAVLQELQFVKDSNIELTGFAASWFRSKTKSLPASQTVEVIPTVIPETSISMEKESIVSDSFTATANPNEYAWIDQILKLPFRTITGKQGSGKSTLERFLISELKKAGFHVIIINPEVNPDKFKGVEVLQTVTQINDFLDEFVNLIEQRQDECRRNGLDEDEYYDFVAKRKGKQGLVAVFFQESNTYEAKGVDPEAWANTLKQCLTNIRKWGFTATLTAHSANQTSIASKLKGFSDKLNEEPSIECLATQDKDGKAVSSGKGLLKIEGKNDASPKTIKLKDFPKTKDFRLSHEKNKSYHGSIISELKKSKSSNLIEAIEELNSKTQNGKVIPEKEMMKLREQLLAIAQQRGDTEFISKFS